MIRDIEFEQYLKDKAEQAWKNYQRFKKALEIYQRYPNRVRTFAKRVPIVNRVRLIIQTISSGSNVSAKSIFEILYFDSIEDQNYENIRKNISKTLCQLVREGKLKKFSRSYFQKV